MSIGKYTSFVWIKNFYFRFLKHARILIKKITLLFFTKQKRLINNIDKRRAEHDINITVKRLIDIFCELQVNSILEKD